jgi:cytochrome c peroxidase
MTLFLRTGLLGASLCGAASLASCSSSSASGAIGNDSGTPDAAAPETGVALRIPQLGPVPALPTWPNDPPTSEKIALGSDLFFDVRLSGSGHTACTSCHGYQTAFQDNLITPIPDRSYPNDRPALTRNTLSFYDIVYAPVMRWDGSQTDLGSAMAFPWSEANMNLGTDVASAQPVLKQRLTADAPGYVPLFQQAYGQDIRTATPDAVWKLAGRALAAFVRQAVSRDAPFDRWNAGDDSAMSASAVAGLEVFRGKGRCIYCHVGPFFTDFSFHNISSSPPGPDGTRADEGRYDVTGLDADRGKFLTPTLRGTYDTAPYFHDGQQPGLFSVLDHLNGPSVTADPNHDPFFDTPLGLTADDETNLVAFITALRGTPVTVVPPASLP